MPNTSQFQGHGRHPHGPPGFIRVLHILKYVATGIVVTSLIFALHRRACSPSRRAHRRARREERRRRRSFNRARRHHAIRRFLARITGRPFDEDSDDFEKREALLANAENGVSNAMSNEILQFRNAAGVVGEIVAAGVPAPQQLPPRVESLSRMPAHDIGSEVGYGEQLPAYEDDADSEVSSIADGLRYTPGSTQYTPSQSEEGSLSDILGADTKN